MDLGKSWHFLESELNPSWIFFLRFTLFQEIFSTEIIFIEFIAHKCAYSNFLKMIY